MPPIPLTQQSAEEPVDIFENARIDAERANYVRHQDHHHQQDDDHCQWYRPPAPGCRVSALHDHTGDLDNSPAYTSVGSPGAFYSINNYSYYPLAAKRIIIRQSVKNEL